MWLICYLVQVEGGGGVDLHEWDDGHLSGGFLLPLVEHLEGVLLEGVLLLFQLHEAAGTTRLHKIGWKSTVNWLQDHMQLDKNYD